MLSMKRNMNLFVLRILLHCVLLEISCMNFHLPLFVFNMQQLNQQIELDTVFIIIQRNVYNMFKLLITNLVQLNT